MNSLAPLGIVLSIAAIAAVDWLTIIPSEDLALAALACLAGMLVWHFRPSRRRPLRPRKLL